MIENETPDPATVTLPSGPFRMFTFGPIHTTRHGIRRDACVIFEGDGDVPLARMHQRFGNEWATSYLAERAQDEIDQWGYVPLTPAELPPVRTDLPGNVSVWIHDVLEQAGEPLYAPGTPEYVEFETELKAELNIWANHDDPETAAYVEYETELKAELSTYTWPHVDPETTETTYRVDHTGATFRDDGSRVWPNDTDFQVAMASVHTGWCTMPWDHPGLCRRPVSWAGSVNFASRSPEERGRITRQRAENKNVRRGEDASRTLYVRQTVPQLDTLAYPGESTDEVRAAITAYAEWLLYLAKHA